MARAASRSLFVAAVLATLGTGVLLLVPMPAGAEGIGPPQSDKIVHVVLFGGLAGLWWWALRPLPRARSLALCTCVALYGGLLELLQMLTPYRSGDWLDFAADAAGAAVAAAVALAVPATWRGGPG